MQRHNMDISAPIAIALTPNIINTIVMNVRASDE
jgi:hypothetical protein